MPGEPPHNDSHKRQETHNMLMQHQQQWGSGVPAQALATAAAQGKGRLPDNVCGAFDAWLSCSPHKPCGEGNNSNSSSSRGNGSHSGANANSNSHEATACPQQQQQNKLQGNEGRRHDSRAGKCTTTATVTTASSYSSSRGSVGTSSGYVQQRHGWASAAVQQAGIEDEVAARMRSYARSRARIEEEIVRRQEARRLGQPSGQLAAAAANRGAGAGGGIAENSSSAAIRTLLHLDSQHKVGSSGRVLRHCLKLP